MLSERDRRLGMRPMPKRGKKRRNRERRKQQAFAREHPWIPYGEYLLSNWWKSKRKQKLASIGFRCENCHAVKNLHVHHLHYRTLWREKDSDLQVLCTSCHQGKHELDIQMNRHLRAIALEV